MSDDDPIVEAARSFLIDIIFELHPPGAEQDRLLAWVAQLPAKDLLLPESPGASRATPRTLRRRH